MAEHKSVRVTMKYEAARDSEYKTLAKQLMAAIAIEDQYEYNGITLHAYRHGGVLFRISCDAAEMTIYSHAPSDVLSLVKPVLGRSQVYATMAGNAVMQ